MRIQVPVRALLCRHEPLKDAVRSLQLLDQQEFPLSIDTICSAIQECSKRKDLQCARLIHLLVDSSGLGFIIFLKDNLIRLFAACGSLQDAYNIFSHVRNPTIFTWNSIISAFIQCREIEEALAIFWSMRDATVEPDKVTFLHIIQACSSLGSPIVARRVHNEVIELGFESDASIGNSLLAMYAKCWSLTEAVFVFDNITRRSVVTWSAIIASFADHDDGLQALKHFEMMQSKSVLPNLFTFSSIMKACGSLQDTDHSYQVHDLFVKSNLMPDLVIGSTLVYMYSKCGRMREAQQVFGTLESCDLIAWGAMISGYALLEDPFGVLDTYEKMEQRDVRANRVIFLLAIKACAVLRAVRKGKCVHNQVIESSLEYDLTVGSALMDMYVKCSSLEEAFKVFRGLQSPDEVMWGVLVAGYAAHGCCDSAWQLLDKMQQHGLKPTDAVFTRILTACCQTGFVDGGHQIFQKMNECGFSPNVEHLACMVDLFARAGSFNVAAAILKTVPISPDAVFWRSLLACSKTYSNVDIGKQCFDEAGMLDPGDASLYLLSSNMYAGLSMLEDANQAENLRICAGAHKKPGVSWIEVGSRIHEFMVSADNLPQDCGVFAKSCRIMRSIRDDDRFVPHPEPVPSGV